ncbi:hypothetical protein M6B38_315885 [Iris pallida]|uniref:Uncharacterized protein n=1 Tax=Iris pallida TaxID=29817 RepID=A0AAX6HFJ4_IRIPA|nr:hypothetical protein M6B38_315885 [Iris pallida]
MAGTPATEFPPAHPKP